MAHPSPAAKPGSQRWPTLLLALAVIAALAYYWPRTSGQATAPAASADIASAPSAAPVRAAPTAATSTGGILLDADGRRILNEAGLPPGPPLPPAKPIPIRAAPGTVIGYSKEADGTAKPIRAGELNAVPNTPGTYAVVDMWADGGPAVVPATVGTQLSPQELARLRASEDRRDRQQTGR